MNDGRCSPELIRRYQNDVVFHTLVDHLCRLLESVHDVDAGATLSDTESALRVATELMRYHRAWAAWEWFATHVRFVEREGK